jgi:cytidylate kinase
MGRGFDKLICGRWHFIREHRLPENGILKIAIDGPAAAGKTVVGTRLASKLGCRFLDTGMMYRAATVAALDAGADFEDLDQLAEVAEAMDIKAVTGEQGETRIILGNFDITDRLRRPDVDSRVSIVSAVPRVREVMVAAQRRIADGGKIVMVGRDIGTVVLTDANSKIYLTASLETRAKRRYLEMESRPDHLPFQEMYDAMKRRDEIDSSREASPLRPAGDAVLVVTDNLSIEQVVCRLAEIAQGTAV